MATISASLSEPGKEHLHPIWGHLVDIEDAVNNELGHVPMPDMLGNDHMGRQFKGE